jgi:hypothetical protein
MFPRAIPRQILGCTPGNPDTQSASRTGQAISVEEPVVPKKRIRSLSLFAYAYLVVPKQAESRLDAIRAIIERENKAAEGAARIWTGRLVQENRITHILIVSDSSEQNLNVNRLLEIELKRMKAEFFLTNPMAIPGSPEELAGADAHSGNGRAKLLPPKILHPPIPQSETP